MSEPKADWEEPHPPPLPLQTDSAPTQAPSALPGVLDNQAFTLDSDEPGDDAPTIISKSIKRATGAATNEGITNSIRGQCLAHFELQEPIGVGGMAAVIRAKDKQLDRIVALKILPPKMALDPESIRRFHHEARAAAKLDHENIARVFFCGEDHGLHFIAFEFVEGENLRMILDRRGRIPVHEAIHYMLQVAAGLEHACSRGVVHRDIKPSNIIITPSGRAKLVDMGLARSLGPQADGSLTQSGVTLGTFDYISPEQALEPREADVRSDIYSLGCTFYHMLTGQPSVPEGTAAKKLHHHQHIAPLDPRQLVPSIPDDVAAVLARMMAKDPNDRYQRPEQLVKHLLQLAKKLGVMAEVPEGVLYVDAPLPAPPRYRPLLVGGVAAGLLVGLILLLGSMGGASSSGDLPSVVLVPGISDPPAVKGDKGTNSTVAQNPNTTGDVPTPTASGPKRVTVHSTRELADALKLSSVHIALAEDLYELNLKQSEGQEEAPGLLFAGKELEILPDDPGRRPTLRLSYYPTAKDQLWAALTVTNGTVTFRNLRFEIHAKGNEIPMTSVAREHGRIRFVDCEFVQTDLPRDAEKPQFSSVQLGGPANVRDGEADVTFDRCLFRGGDKALLWTSPLSVQMTNCAFGPYTAPFCFRDSKVTDAELALVHCTMMLDSSSTAFWFSGGASARLAVSHCLFSAPVAPGSQGGAVLIRQTGDRVANIRYQSENRNVYHNLSAYWIQGSRTRAATLDEFRVEAGTGRNDRSVALAMTPWAMDKPASFVRGNEPKKAFQANANLSQLRQSTDRNHMVGVETCTWGSLYPAELPRVEQLAPEVVVRKDKVVDPSQRVSDQGVYPTLGQALGEAQNGDVITIRHNGVLPVELARLEKPVDVTIRPAEGFRPILSMGPTPETDASLFRVHDGKLTFENLEFQLPAPRPKFTSQSVVLLAGDGQCIFKKCLATLEEAREGIPQSLVALSDSTMVMKMEPTNPGKDGPPRIELKGCFVRGEGTLLNVRVSRPFNLEMEDTLVALDGSFLQIEGSSREPASRPGAEVKLNHVTVYVTEHLLVLRACKDKTMPGLVPIKIAQVTNCLFASARGKKSLVHLDGMDNDEQMKNLISWGEACKGNVYSGFLALLDQRARPDAMMTLAQLDERKWEAFTQGETGHRFSAVKFADWVAGDRSLARAWPSQLKIKEPELIGTGAPVDRLPRPSAEQEAAPSSSPDGQE